MISTETLHRWHIDVLLAVRCLTLAGHTPVNEEDLAAQLGYQDLDEFERDCPEIEKAIRDLNQLGLMEIDEELTVTLTPGGLETATRLVGRGV